MNDSKGVHLVLTFADDTVGIMLYVTESRLISRGTSDAEVWAEIRKSAYPEEKLPVKSFRPLGEHEGEFVKDRTYRNAWRDSGGTMAVHMPHARDIHRQMLRAARVPALAQLDVDYLRATEAGDTAAQARAVAAKQRLRDAPAHPDIEAAQTPAQLQAVWPVELKG